MQHHHSLNSAWGLNRAWTVLLTLVLCLISSASFGASILNWSLDDGNGSVAADSSGQANTGTLNGGVSWVPGRVGGALSFNGSNAALTRANVQGMSLGNTPHTIAAWVKVNALPSKRAWIMLLGPEASGSHHWLINSSAVTQLGVWNGAQVKPSLPVGVWKHIAITFDGAQLKGYIDGTLIGTQAASFNLTGTALTVAKSHVGEQYFNGEVDEFKVYNSALTAAEVATLAGATAPALSIATTTLPNGTVGNTYSQTLAATGGTAPYTWSITAGSLPAGLSLNTAGTISGTPTAAGTSNITVRVTDATNATADRALALSITNPVGGSTPLLDWSLNDGSGSMASDSSGGGNHGAISGGATWIPGRVGGALSFNGSNAALTRASVQGMSLGNTPHTIAAWVKVNALPSKRAWIMLLGPEASGSHHWLINSSAVTQLGVWNGAQVKPSLPVGVWKHIAITFDGAQLKGYIDGTLIGTQAASFNLTGTALTVAKSHVGEQYFNGEVDEFKVYNSALTAAEVGTLAGASANTPPTVSLIAPSNGASYTAPATITLTANAADSDGSISKVEFYNGTALLNTDTASPYTYDWTGVAAGSYALTAKAYDNGGASTTSSVVTVIVNAPGNVPPSISSVSATPQTLLDNATSQLQVTANDPDAGPAALSYTWSIVSGGGSLSSPTIANPIYTPANVSTSTPVTLNVVVSDGAASVNQNIVLTVNDAGEPITISTSSLADGTAGSPYSQTLTATGGVTPYTWSITTGSLPAGLSLNSAGTISGTPSAVGSSSFTVQVQDNAGSSAIQPLSLVINAISGSNLYYLYADHLNTPRVITDTSNTVVWRWDSDPFGTDAANEDPDGDGRKFVYNPRFPGQYFDKETGLHYNYFRDYEPTSGRYVQSDPIGLEGGFNTYGYVFGNPLSLVDPEGLETQQSTKPETKWLSCSECAKKVVEIAKKKQACEAELNACKTNVDEIQFIEKYNGTGFASALYNCKTEFDPTLFVRLTWGCWRCTQRVRLLK